MTRITVSAQNQQLAHELAAANALIHSLEAQVRDFSRQSDQMLTQHAIELKNAKEDGDKKLRDKDSTANYITKEKDKFESELEQAHAVLDSVDGAPAREYDTGKEYPRTLNRNVVTRLAGALLAISQRNRAA